MGKTLCATKRRAAAIRLFLAQFKDFMTILLICAAVIPERSPILRGTRTK